MLNSYFVDGNRLSQSVASSSGNPLSCYGNCTVNHLARRRTSPPPLTPRLCLSTTSLSRTLNTTSLGPTATTHAAYGRQCCLWQASRHITVSPDRSFSGGLMIVAVRWCCQPDLPVLPQTSVWSNDQINLMQMPYVIVYSTSHYFLQALMLVLLGLDSIEESVLMQVFASLKVTNPETAAVLVILSGLLLKLRAVYRATRTGGFGLQRLSCRFVD